MTDVYDQWLEYESRQERQLRSRPVCERCGEYIQEETLWDMDGTLYCEECAREEFLKHTEYYME